MNAITASQKEDLRHAVLEFLTLRHPTASPARAIRRTIAREVDWNVAEEEVNAALELLEGLGLVRHELDNLGATKYWQATSAGVLAQERNEK